MMKNSNISPFGKLFIICSAVLAIIMVSGKWLDLSHISMLFSGANKYEYTLFEIADFIELINIYANDSYLSTFTGLLITGAVVSIILNILIILLTVFNSKLKKPVLILSVIVSVILAFGYISVIASLNAEMKQLTFGVGEALFKMTANPCLLVVFSVLSLVGTRFKKASYTANSVQKEHSENKLRCLKCGSEIDNDVSFCNYCGAAIISKKVRNEKFCSQCGATIEEGMNFCAACGNRID